MARTALGRNRVPGRRPRPGSSLYTRLPAPILNQAGYRGRNDDGSETTATWIAAENTDWTQDVDVNFRVRWVVDERAGGDAPSIDYKYQYNLNGAGWNDVTASSLVVRASASGSVANGVPTTRQLVSGGSGSFRAGAVDTNNGAFGLVDLSPDELTELEACMQIRSADVADGDTIQLRVFNNSSGIALDAYDLTPTITAAEVVLEQTAFRGRNDDGDEATASWKAAENTDWTQDVDENFRVRFAISNTGGKDEPSSNTQLQYNLNGAGWNNVDAASSVVRSSASPNVADNTILTDQMTAGSGSFDSGGQFDEVNGLDALGGIAAGDHTQQEFCIQILSADVVDADTIQLRVIRQGGSLLNTYTATPTITVNEGAAALTAAATGRLHVRGTSSPTATNPARGRIHVRGTAKPTSSIAARGRVHVRATAAGFKVVPVQTAAAVARVHLRATVTGNRVVPSAPATARIHITGEASGVVPVRAVGRIHLRTRVVGTAIGLGSASSISRIHVRGTARGFKIGIAGANARVHVRSTARGVGLGQTRARLHLRVRAVASTPPVLKTSSAVARIHLRGQAFGSKPIPIEMVVRRLGSNENPHRLGPARRVWFNRRRR